MSAVLRPDEAQLRPMTQADLAPVMEIELCAYEFPWTEGIFADCLRVGYSCWVAEFQGALRGYGVMSFGAGESHLLNLCVDPDFQRHGLGMQLLTHLLELARQRDVDTALLEVRPSNQAAVALYERVGFNEVGRRRAYYPGSNGREDAMILALDLSSDAQSYFS